MKTMKVINMTRVVALFAAALLTLFVAWAQSFPCDSVFPICPPDGSHPFCYNGVFSVTPPCEADLYACDGRQDCGQGMPPNECNIWTVTPVIGATVTCTNEESGRVQTGFCVIQLRGPTMPLNARCSDQGPCDPTRPADPLPLLEPIYSGETGGTVPIPPIKVMVPYPYPVPQ